ncbi:TIGR03943 family putative permease subunit [Anaerospora hongkongensis]|uniref:TIGR03943 family putative permease subunit n=1 Tax=Anaerospora hongkongensis TaxID=244830 RepID=UPI002FD97028
MRHKLRSKYVLDWDALLRSAILLGFIILLIRLIKTEQLTLYINPKFSSMLEIAAYLLIPMLAAQLLTIYRPIAPLHEPHKHGSRWSYLPFIVVLLLAFALPDHVLNANLVGTKGLNSQTAASTMAVYEMSRPLAATLRQAPLIKVTDKDYTEIMNELQFFTQDYVDKEITMTGFVFTPPGATPKQFSLVRYVVVCCTADALPYGILCEAEDKADYEEGMWLTVTGRIQQVPYEDKMVPSIKLTSVKKVPEPKAPYVFPPS